MKKIKKLFIATAAISIAATNIAMAENLLLAKRVVKDIHANAQFDAFLPIAASQVKAQLASKYPDYSKDINDIVNAEALSLVKRRAELDDAAAKVYAKHFTDTELKSIADFYESPAGMKLIKTGPETIGDLMKEYQKWSVSVGTELQNKSLDKLAAKYHIKK